MKKSCLRLDAVPANALDLVRQELRLRNEREAQERRDRAFSSYEDYLLYVHRGRWKTAPHLRLICRTLESVERGEVSRAILTMPPRHGKSMSVTESFPSWFLGRHPERRVIEVSYGDTLARKFGRSNRRKLEEFGREIFGVEIAQDNASVTDWGLQDHAGGMLSAGVGAGITGAGADLIIIDDPIKNRQDAESLLKRERLWDEWQSSILTRLHPGGSVLVIMTRWHEDDLAGRLLREEADEWTYINLPCAAEENDPMGRKLGEPLWPERFGVKWLEKKRRSVGSRVWDSLYQGHPRPSEGGLFKAQSFRRFRVTPDGAFYVLPMPGGDKVIAARDCLVFQTCDVAGSMRTSADYFVLGTFALTPEGDLLLLDVLRLHIEGPDQPSLMRQKFAEWRPIVVGLESKNMGLTLYQQVVRDGLPVVELKAETDKYTRALPAAARYEAGKVWHREGAPWLDDLESELLAFPNGAHDDQVDVVAYAVHMQEWNYLSAASGPRDRAMIFE